MLELVSGVSCGEAPDFSPSVQLADVSILGLATVTGVFEDTVREKNFM